MFIINNKDLIYLQRNFCREIIIFWPKIGKYALNQRRELTGHVNQFCSSLYVKTRLKCCFCNAHCVLNGILRNRGYFLVSKSVDLHVPRPLTSTSSGPLLTTRSREKTNTKRFYVLCVSEN